MAKDQETSRSSAAELRRYSTVHGLILGYHGTDESIVRDVVLRQRELLPSRNSWDWIGHGIYFWEHSPSRAMEFAISSSKRKGTSIKKPAVLGAVLELGTCLDLLDYGKLAFVKDTYESKLKDLFENLQNLPGHSESSDLLIRMLDCAVIEAVHDRAFIETLPPFDSVRAVFFEGNLLYPNAGFREKNHIQICIRNPACIKGSSSRKSQVLKEILGNFWFHGRKIYLCSLIYEVR